MYLCYIDESGNTGRRLDDPDQPIHWIAAVLVPETRVAGLTQHLDAIVSAALPAAPEAEVHAAELHGGDGAWRGVNPVDRVAVFDAFLDALPQFECTVSYASINKPALMARNYGTPGTPHLLALQFLCEKVEAFLARQADPMRQRALLIADETHEHERFAIEQLKRQQQGRGGEVPGIQTAHLVDNIHFVRSQDSRAVQLADVVAYVLNRGSRLPASHPSRLAYNRFEASIDKVRAEYRHTWP